MCTSGTACSCKLGERYRGRFSKQISGMHKKRSEKEEKMFKLKIYLLGFLILFTLIFTKSVMNDYINGEEVIVHEMTEDKKETYCCQFIFFNLDALAEERDLIVVYDKEGNIQDAFYIYDNEKNHVFDVSTENFIVTSDLLGKIDVYHEGNGKAYVFVDYLNKTMTYECREESTN